MSALSLTFAQLKSCMRERSAAGGAFPPASLPNAMSALKDFMSERQCGDDQPVGALLRGTYKATVEAHLASLRAAGRPSEYVRNRRALLKRWRRLLLDLDQESAAALGAETPFQRALRALVHASSAKAVAQATGLSYATLKRWLAGSVPRVGMEGKVRVLERHFAQVPGTLTDLLPRTVQRCADTQPAPVQIAYRKRLSEQTRQPYALKDVSPALRREWLDFLEYKTSFGATGLQRAARGKWSLTERPVKRKREYHWFAAVPALGGRPRYCATAAIQWAELTRYLGWLTLSAELGGAALPTERAQSMACYLDLGNLERYLNWRIARSGGALHQGIAAVLKSVSALCHPKTGYLTQTRSRFPHHPSACAAAQWAAACQATLERTRQLSKEVTHRPQCARNSREPIAHILSLHNPLSAITVAIARMNAARPSTGGVAEAIWARDRLMVKLSASNPLRAKNLKLLTIEVSDKGESPQLHKRDGVWRIAIAREDFKNLEGAAKDRDYDMPVDRSVWTDLERYIREYRPLLASAANPYLFVCADSPDDPMHSLNQRIACLTRRYFPECPGTGPHVMRHIVATSILKQHPNAWSAAAYALHDREETVRKHYAHLSCDDAARWLGDLLGSALSGGVIQ